jgi:DNA-binding NtrC family response regulator
VGGNEDDPRHTCVILPRRTGSTDAARSRSGKFREDLYYRLNVVTIDMRRRCGSAAEDIQLLVDFFRERANFNMGKQVEGVAPSCLKLLQSYSWPGNVRELENAVERAVMFCQGRTITVADLSPEVRDYLSEMTTCPDEFDLSCNVRDTERKCIVRALQQTGGNRSQAAKLLGISRKRLWEKMKEMQVLID